ncbi:NDE1, mitochondrial external NADH dehydrogenase [Rhizopogon salebrosus TDB-379]|nr:NDE1, mitochondrial external NADH dehydrogenase [Rhizopogon salebrosus TDB-379]
MFKARLSVVCGRVQPLPAKRLVTAARTFASSAPRSKQRLVILGSGWGGYEILRGIDKKRWNVTIVSPTNAFNFTPLLASCAVGTLEFRCAIEPVRRYSPQVSWCDAIDFKQKTLKCVPATPPLEQSASAPLAEKSPTETGFTLRYDKLVIAVGAYSQTFNVPGVKEHAHFLKDVRDARAIRARIIECKCFEQANQPVLSDIQRRNLLNFCIVGGGPTGVEFSAELHDLLHAELERHYPALARMAKITLYDVAPNILGNFDKSLGVYAEDKFRRDGISIKTRHHVERVEKDRMFVKEQGEVPFGLLVWSTGLAPNPLIQSIDSLEKHEKTHRSVESLMDGVALVDICGVSSLFTDQNLNIITKDGHVDPDVWAIGDAANIKGQLLPATAQVANQKGKYLAQKLNKIVKDQEHTKPFEFHNKGSLAYLGDWKAIYDRSSADTVKTKESGRLAWLLWRSAYFTMTLSIRNKILVPTYWFLNWIFGRDLTRF